MPNISDKTKAQSVAAMFVRISKRYDLMNAIMTGGAHNRWRRLAAEIKIEPKKVPFIEARGFLCHELMYLLGGNIEFVETAWNEFI
ncbi:MAG: hypothetical protein CL876_05440 [Dehalococcoidales bacterium]|jgi:hypothetical protein|nr:hypothetical protein [Dehalococcoidales bacterium]